METQPDAVTSQQEQLRAERGEKTAENVRYGQAISEGGMGGKTTEAGGDANQGKGALREMMLPKVLKFMRRRIRSDRCTGSNRR